MEECLQVLDEAQECPYDQILVEQVRLQLIVEKMALCTSLAGNALFAESVKLQAQHLHAQLQGIRARILDEFADNGKYTF